MKPHYSKRAQIIHQLGGVGRDFDMKIIIVSISYEFHSVKNGFHMNFMSKIFVHFLSVTNTKKCMKIIHQETLCMNITEDRKSADENHT